MVSHWYTKSDGEFSMSLNEAKEYRQKLIDEKENPLLRKITNFYLNDRVFIL